MSRIKQLVDRMGRFIEGSRYSGIVIALFCFIFIALLSLTDVYELFELKLFDIRCRIKPSIAEWDRLSFVDFDENTTTTLGQFPWPRRIYADGLDVLREVGVSQHSFDIMLPDESPAQTDTEALDGALKRAREGGRLKVDDLEKVSINNDRLFAQGVERMGRALLAYTFSEDPLSDEVLKRQELPSFLAAQKRFMERATVEVPAGKRAAFESMRDPRIIALSYPIPELMKSGHMFGFVNRDTDIDGSLRKVRLVRYHEGRLYVNLSLAMFMDACGVSIKDLDMVPGKYVILKNALHPRTHERKDVLIPVDREGMMYVNWAGPGPREKSFHIIPFYALLDYNKYAPAVHDFFDTMENSHDFRLSKLYGKYDENKKKYGTAKNAEARKKIADEMILIRKDIVKVKRDYAGEMRAEADRLKAEYEKTNDPSAKHEYELRLDDYHAIEVVNRVEELQDHITITGLTATGTHDIGAIPLYNEYARVGTYHNTVNTIYQGDYITRATSAVNLALMMLLALGMGFLVQKMDARRSMITILASFVGLNAVVTLLFILFNLWISQLGLSLALIIPSTFIAGIKFVQAESQKRFIKNAFSRYLAPGVIDKIIEHPESLQLGGENREITIFFSDVAGFSTISEKLTPPELVALLNEYLSEMTDIILSHGGTVDKYEGDAIMAFYGAPHDLPDHALRACLASIDMKKKLREMQDHWKSIGQVALSCRMGMNTGDAVVGNMGSRMRMDYTAMGDSVNLASRLEGANKFYSTGAMISEMTYEQAKEHIEARRLDRIRVVGKSQPILVYELIGRKGTLPDHMVKLLEHYYEGLDHFEKHQWKKALLCFQEGYKIVPDDGPTKTYIERCEEFIKKPPSKNWDGVYTFKSK